MTETPRDDYDTPCQEIAALIRLSERILDAKGLDELWHP